MSLSAQEYARYSRHFALDAFGEKEQLKLKNARVLLVGCGGLGCPSALYLAAVGVGNIGIIDDDVVSASNLHRQILYTAADLGKPKVEVAATKLSQQNPYVQIIPIKNKLTTENAIDIIQDYDVVIDGTDNFPTRYLVNDACVILDRMYMVLSHNSKDRYLCSIFLMKKINVAQIIEMSIQRLQILN